MPTIIPNNIRKRILELAFLAGKSGAHIGGSMSLVEILAVLYNNVLKDISDSAKESRDRLILSKGHGALALYCVLERRGLINKNELNTFESNGTKYFAHAKRNIKEGLEFSGGSLSLGLSFAVGVALSCKSRRLDNNIYVILGDGECNEGLIWESLMSISNYNLSNITIIIDKNGLQSDGQTNDIMNIGNLKDKLEAFGFYTQEVDGHNINALELAFNSRKLTIPNAIIANTIKGRGISFIEKDVRGCHHSILTEDLYNKALKDIE